MEPDALLQRHGRIDGIGSPNAEVYLCCVFPDEQFNDLLGLEERGCTGRRRAPHPLAGDRPPSLTLAEELREFPLGDKL